MDKYKAYRLLAKLILIILQAVALSVGVLLVQNQAIKNDIKKDQYIREIYRQSPIDFFNNSKYRRYYDEYLSYSKYVIEDIELFPVDISYRNRISYEDSFGNVRSYGGDRKHEGIDLMDCDNTRGQIPVLSMTDGYIKNLGWLTLGGYRIGIQAPSGMYYYYAHMDSYAPKLKIGDQIYAGQFIGFMGDTGYGDEGTKGQFPVHLHIGIYYYDTNGNEISLNPYPFLVRKDALKHVEN